MIDVARLELTVLWCRAIDAHDALPLTRAAALAPCRGARRSPPAARAFRASSICRDAPRQARRAMTTILVVDDDPGVRYALTEVLRDRGHRVITASSGPERSVCSKGRRGGHDLSCRAWTVSSCCRGSRRARRRCPCSW